MAKVLTKALLKSTIPKTRATVSSEEAFHAVTRRTLRLYFLLLTFRADQSFPGPVPGVKCLSLGTRRPSA